MKNISVTPINHKIGDKVVRGKDWKYNDQDYDSEYGTIIKSLSSNTWVHVEWENGDVNAYRTGENNQDLYFYTKQLTNSLINRIGHLLI